MASRTTELEAVQEILSVLGRRPVNSLDPDDLTPDAAFALQRLRFALKMTLSIGWHWNRDENVQFVPDGNNQIVIPDNVLRVTIAKQDRFGTRRSTVGSSYRFSDLTMRRDPSDGLMKLFDRSAHSRDEDPFDFSQLSEARLDLVRALDFEDIPDACRLYVTIRAGRAVQARLVGDPALHRFYLEDELAARTVLLRDETDSGQYNMLNERLTRFTARRDLRYS